MYTNENDIECVIGLFFTFMGFKVNNSILQDEGCK